MYNIRHTVITIFDTDELISLYKLYNQSIKEFKWTEKKKLLWKLIGTQFDHNINGLKSNSSNSQPQH